MPGDRAAADPCWFDGREASRPDDGDLPDPEPLPGAGPAGSPPDRVAGNGGADRDAEDWLFEQPERPDPGAPLREVTAPTDANRIVAEPPGPIAAWSFSALREAARSEPSAGDRPRQAGTGPEPAERDGGRAGARERAHPPPLPGAVPPPGRRPEGGGADSGAGDGPEGPVRTGPSAPGRTPFWGVRAQAPRGGTPPGRDGAAPPPGEEAVEEQRPGTGQTPIWGSRAPDTAGRGDPGPTPLWSAPEARWDGGPSRRAGRSAGPRFAPAHAPLPPSVTQGRPYIPPVPPPWYPSAPGGPVPAGPPAAGYGPPASPLYRGPGGPVPPTGPYARPGPYPPPWPPPRTGAAPMAAGLGPKPEVDITRGWHRLHGATVALRATVATLVFLALPGALLPNVFGLGWTLLLTLSVALGSAAYSLVAWWNTYFGLKGDHLVLHTGLFRQLSREIPLSRLQAVDVVRPLFMQVVGLAELRVELAGGDSGELRLRYLGRRQAERLRASLLAHAAGLSGRTPEAPESPLYKLPFSLLIGAMVFRIPVLAAFMLFMLLIVAGLAFGEPGVLGGAVPLLLGLIRGFVGPLLRYIDFYASLSPDGLRLRYGVFQARMQTVPPGRVQAVRIVEPLLWRFLRVVRVEANVAGYVGERQTDSSTLLPVVPRTLAYALVGELFPDSDVSSVALHPARVRAGREELGVDDRLFVTRRGLFCRVVEVVPHSRMQTLRMTMGPWARWRGVATVEVDTPPGPVHARAPHRELGEARRVVDGVAVRAERARAAAGGPERWATRSDTSRRGPGP